MAFARSSIEALRRTYSRTPSQQSCELGEPARGPNQPTNENESEGSTAFVNPGEAIFQLGGRRDEPEFAQHIADQCLERLRRLVDPGEPFLHFRSSREELFR